MFAQKMEVFFVFYDVYSKLCAERGESPFNLPVKLGLQKSNSAVAQWQAGSVPRKKTLEGLAEHFDVSVAYLMGLETKETTFYPTVFYKNFIKLCNQKGITPTGLVLKLGLSSSNASVWKNGGTPRPDALRKIADYFAVTTEYLLTENEKTPSEPQSEGLQAEFIRLFNALSPEQQQREIAYLKELTGGKDS